MSRTDRHHYSQVKATPGKPRKLSLKEALDKLRREMKRRLIKDDLIVDPAKRGPRVKWTWYQCFSEQPPVGRGGEVLADTRSQAKALIKKKLGIPAGKRLPANVEITGVPLDPTTTASA